MRLCGLVVAVLGLMGCTPKVASRLEVSARPVTSTCATVQGAKLGALPLELDVGGHTVRFREWTMADAASSELLGFAAEVPAGVQFTVRAGEREFSGVGSRWRHPAGFAGPRVQGIDAVTFCAPDVGESLVAVR